MEAINYKDGDAILIEGTRYIIGKTKDGGFILMDAKSFVPADAFTD